MLYFYVMLMMIVVSYLCINVFVHAFINVIFCWINKYFSFVYNLCYNGILQQLIWASNKRVPPEAVLRVLAFSSCHWCTRQPPSWWWWHPPPPHILGHFCQSVLTVPATGNTMNHINSLKGDPQHERRDVSIRSSFIYLISWHIVNLCEYPMFY